MEDLEAFAFAEVAYVVLVELVVEQVRVVVQNSQVILFAAQH